MKIIYTCMIIIFICFMWMTTLLMITTSNKDEIQPIYYDQIKIIEIKPIEDLAINHILSNYPDYIFAQIISEGKDNYLIIKRRIEK